MVNLNNSKVSSRVAAACLASVSALLAHPACALDAGTQGDTSAREQALALMGEFFSATADIHDYTQVMTKQQRIKDALQAEEVLLVKHRQAPECRYMTWIGDRKKGREMIYCANRYGGEIQAHDSGVLSFYNASFKPDGSFYARLGQLHPVDDIGIYPMARMIKQDSSYITAHPELPAPTLASATVAGAASTCIDLAQGPELFSAYHAGRRELCLDDKLHLPTRLKIWNQQGQLMEQYTFSDYKLNIGLTDADFDTKNSAYHF